MAAPLAAGTRWPGGGTISVETPDGPDTITFELLGRFQMRGLGYTHPKWGHGLYHGKLAVEREDFGLAQCDPRTMDNYHVQFVSRVQSARYGEGTGVFEQLIIGPYAPLGLKEFMDVG
ncbi:MAG: hypothetical protein RL671_31, partial [Pseudomonadota bacterium]